jgi:YVTN family beta-propeller protein
MSRTRDRCEEAVLTMRIVTMLLAMAALLSEASAAPAATLYITNTKSASISIIDTNTFEVTGTIPLGNGKPNRIQFHPDGKTAWVIYDKSHELGVIDAEMKKLVKRVKIGGNPYNLTFAPDGKTLYVLDWSSETSGDAVIAYDLAAERVEATTEVSTWPAYAVFSRDAHLLYVSGETAGDVTVIDTKTHTTVTRIVHGGGDAMGLALSSDGKTLWVAAGENKAVLKVDTATNKVMATIPVPGVIHEATLTLDGKFLYTTLRKANKIAVISTDDDRVVTTIPQKAYPDLVVMEPAGHYAFVTNRWADAVTVIDVSTHKQVRAIPVGRAPHGMTLRPR